MSEKKKGRFSAWRLLDRQTVKDVAPATWVLWRRTSDYYRGMGYRAGKFPPESGDLLVQSPYADWYNLTWGLAPNQDMPKWRWMYRSRPEIRRGVDVKVILAVGRAFAVVCEKDKEIETYVTQLLNHLNVKDVLQSAVTDMLVYGQAYFEKVRTVAEEKQEYEELEMSPIERRASVQTNRWATDTLDVDNPKEAALRLKAWTEDIQKIDRWLAEDETKEAFAEEYSRKRERFYAEDEHYRVKQAKRWEAQQRTDPTPRDYEMMGRGGGLPPYSLQPTYVPRGPTVGGVESGQDPIGGTRRERAGSIPERETEFQPDEGELVELKAIDPLWMRVNRDSFGNVEGFVQWGLTPIPQAIISEKIVYLRWLPKSWAHENAYGTSILMPVQRHVSMIIQAEEDMKLFWHQYAKPSLWVAAGTPERPYPVPALTTLVNAFAGRQPNTDFVTPGDVKVEVLKGGTGDTTNTFRVYVKYLREKIYETIGIPSILMNLPDQTTRATSDVSLQAFIAEERMIQELMSEQFLKQVIEPEVRRHFAGKYPMGDIPSIKIVWPSILEEDRNKKADRVVKALGAHPYMTVNEARSEVGLEPIEDAQFDEIPETVLTGMQPSKNPEQSEATRTGPREEMQQKIDSGSQTGEPAESATAGY